MYPRREALEAVFRAAVDAVDGARLTGAALRRAPLAGPVWVLGLGKVAGAMAEGAVRVLGDAAERVVLATAAGAPTPAGAEVLLGEHPLPGPGSLAAGRRLLEVAAEARARGARCLVLVSGGGSSLAEVPAPGLDLEEVAAAHRRLLASGAPIGEINAARQRLSALKGGGLARALGPALARVLVLADVPSGRAGEVASGPCDLGPHAPFDTEVLATPGDLAAAAAEAARARGLAPVVLRPAADPVPGRVATATVDALAAEIGAHLTGGAGLWIAAGEVGVARPGDGAGQGGRATHLAAAVLQAMAGAARPFAFLAGASDGRDGDGGGGAAVDGDTACDPEDLAGALARFDTGPLHRRLGTALGGFPPRTNLTDLYLALAPAGPMD